MPILPSLFLERARSRRPYTQLPYPHPTDHYDVIVAKYGLDCKLLFTDTDSLCYHIKTEDLYRDMLTIKDDLDTSNYPKDSEHDVLKALYSPRNAKVLGKFKYECGGKAPLKFVGLRAKMYSLLASRRQTKMTTKGIKKSYVKKHVTHEMFLHTLRNKTYTTAHFLQFQSRNHVICTQEIDKICLSAYDDKRYISVSYTHLTLPTIYSV